MGQTDNQAEKQAGGVPANRIALPIVILFIILHLLVVFLFVSISRESRAMSATMQKMGEYTTDATDLLAGSSKLSETSSGFILMPVTENGEINYTPLMAYAGELKEDRRGSAVAARFETYGVSDEDRAYIDEAAESADAMYEAQLHALALMNSIYPFTDVPALSSIPLPELSAKEQAYPEEQKIGAARQMVLGTEYALNKQTVSNDVSVCVANLKKESAAKVAAMNVKVTQYRRALWAAIIAVVSLLVFTFAVIYQQILVPISRITQQIREDKPLSTISGIREVREMAVAYNGLLHRRDTLDSILRSAAETDTLTGLPNRYAFRQYLIESHDEGYSLGLLMFDVNYLKQTNDTLGHKAGDELLRNAAECISRCFGTAGESNCFRLGGDEFAAVLKDPTTDLLNNDIKLFLMEQQSKQISISWGYALASELIGASVEELIDAADKRMYERKKEMHATGAAD